MGNRERIPPSPAARCSPLLDSFLPCGWVAVKVHDSDNDHYILLHCVDQPIRKPSGSAAAMMLGDSSPSFRLPQDPVHGPLNFIDELQPEAWNCSLVVSDRISQVLLRGRKKTVRHLWYLVRSSRRTVGPSSALISPLWKASRRASASSPHAV